MAWAFIGMSIPTLRIIPAFATLLFALSSGVATAQSVVVNGSAGPTMVDSGYSVAGSVGFAPTSHLTLLLNLERTHLFSRVTRNERGGSSFRGGTTTLGAAELRVSLLRRDRVTPYGLVGFAAGVSQPNVTGTFRDRVTNDVRATFFGGGIQVPLRDRLSLFADARIMVGAEADELWAVLPVRAGITWQF